MEACDWTMCVVSGAGRSNLCLGQGPFLLLLLPLGHVLVVLLGLCKGRDEGVEDPEEHVWF